MLLALAASWVAVAVYFGSSREEEASEGGTFEFGRKSAFELVAGLTAGWVCAFVVFLGLMRKGYRRTFWSTETGNEWLQSYIMEVADDETKSKIITSNRAKWSSVESQVEE